MRRSIVRKLILGCAAGAAVWLAGTSAAMAAPCLPTGEMRDGMPLTAAEINPTAVSGDHNGMGCDIAVYVNMGHTTVMNATVHNARYFGVLTNGTAGASTDVSHSTIQNIGDPGFSGTQHGIGIEWEKGATGSIDSSVIKLYQKGGAVVANQGTRADVTNDTITGLGPVSFIAQNGVEYIDHSSGTASGNLITDNDYTGCSNQQAAKTGCTPFVAVGLLLYNVNPFDVTRFNNLYRDDQRNELVAPAKEIAAQSK